MSLEPGRFEQVRPVRLYQRIVEQVEEAVLRGDLRPGERLPSERELVEQFGASRSTVREALRVLESNGVVRSRPGDPHGPEILAFSPEGLSKQMRRLAHVEQLSLAELVSFRMVLDASANALAARLRSEEELEAMEATLATMAKASGTSYDAFSEADFAFHEAVAAASRNTLIQVCTAVVRDVVLSLISDKLTRAASSKAVMRRSLKHHEDVLAAIRDRDGARAGTLARRSLYDYYSGYLSESDREPLLALLPADGGQP
jgi:GntR family transcriptional repressor for pyruvate dehydrogenase complex